MTIALFFYDHVFFLELMISFSICLVFHTPMIFFPKCTNMLGILLEIITSAFKQKFHHFVPWHPLFLSHLTSCSNPCWLLSGKLHWCYSGSSIHHLLGWSPDFLNLVSSSSTVLLAQYSLVASPKMRIYLNPWISFSTQVFLCPIGVEGGSNSRSWDQQRHALPTALARCPCSGSFCCAFNKSFQSEEPCR